MARYRDRSDAGRALAAALKEYEGRDDLLVLALPRGGVPVAYEVADALGAELDVIVVRKLGVPWQPELAMGAMASGDLLIINREVVNAMGLTDADLHRAAGRAREMIHKTEHMYRNACPAPEMRSRVVILVDDGLATGSTMRAAIAAIRQHQPAKIVAAIPTAPADACSALRLDVDEVVCPWQPQWFSAISESYDSFDQVSDEQVVQLLMSARQTFERRQKERPRRRAQLSR